MKSIAIISVAAEQGDYVARVKCKPTCSAGFEIPSPDALRSHTEPVSVRFQPIPETHGRLSARSRPTEPPRQNKGAFLPSPAARITHTCVGTRVFQQIRGRTCSRASRRSPERALALRAPTAGGGGAGGGAAPAPAPGPRPPRAGTAPPSPAHRRGSAGLVPSSPWLPAIYFVPLVKKMKVAATNERFLC